MRNPIEEAVATPDSAKYPQRGPKIVSEDRVKSGQWSTVYQDEKWQSFDRDSKEGKVVLGILETAQTFLIPEIQASPEKFQHFSSKETSTYIFGMRIHTGAPWRVHLFAPAQLDITKMFSKELRIKLEKIETNYKNGPSQRLKVPPPQYQLSDVAAYILGHPPQPTSITVSPFPYFDKETMRVVREDPWRFILQLDYQTPR